MQLHQKKKTKMKPKVMTPSKKLTDRETEIKVNTRKKGRGGAGRQEKDGVVMNELG